jgi:replicative DNA helicase
MADLRGSGAVEQDADVILMLHRDAYYTDGQDILDGKVKDDEAQILVEKNRDGRTGTAHVGWIGKCGVFSSGRPAASATYGI